MSQVNQPSQAPASSEPGPICRAPAAASARAAPPVQARQQFDAALERAQDWGDEPGPEPQRPAHGPADARKPRNADHDTDPEQRDAFGALGSLHPFAGLQPGALPAGAVAGAEGLPGGAPTQLPLPPSQTGLGAQSQPGQAIGGARQYNLALPGEPNAAALSLRLTQASPTHWQLRLSADAATRQQLAPHVERLRDRLRQRQGQGQHSADFELEDDAGA